MGQHCLQIVKPALKLNIAPLKNSRHYNLGDYCGNMSILLFIFTSGCSRALICKLDEARVLRVAQLTVDHNLSNSEELERLTSLGLSVDMLSGKLGHNEYTRTMGDCSLKCYYKDMEQLR